MRKYYNNNYFYRWGIFKNWMDIIRNQKDGHFILMKDYSQIKPLIKLYRVPEPHNDVIDDI